MRGSRGQAQAEQPRERLEVEPRAAQEPKREPSGEVHSALHITIAPTWFDPGEALSSNTPYLMLYLVHDALVKPMPGQRMAPGLAES